jgi:hypothetical protein
MILADYSNFFLTPKIVLSNSFTFFKCCLAIFREIFSRLSKFKNFSQFSILRQLITFLRPPACWNIFNAFRTKNNGLSVGRNTFNYILIYKSFDVKLAEYKEKLKYFANEFLLVCLMSFFLFFIVITLLQYSIWVF